MLPLLIGLVPCPITLSVLLIAVALGMATTLTGIALLAIALRASIAAFLDRHAGLLKGMEIVGALTIALIGIALFWGAVARPKGLPF